MKGRKMLVCLGDDEFVLEGFVSCLIRRIFLSEKV